MYGKMLACISHMHTATAQTVVFKSMVQTAGRMHTDFTATEWGGLYSEFYRSNKVVKSDLLRAGFIPHRIPSHPIDLVYERNET